MTRSHLLRNVLTGVVTFSNRDHNRYEPFRRKPHGSGRNERRLANNACCWRWKLAYSHELAKERIRLEHPEWSDADMKCELLRWAFLPGLNASVNAMSVADVFHRITAVLVISKLEGAKQAQSARQIEDVAAILEYEGTRWITPT